MRIWLDTARIVRLASNECPPPPPPDDCGGPDRASNNEDLRNIRGPLIRTTLQSIRANMLQQVAPLYVHSCNDEYWLVCHTASNGRVIVMDTQALTLLEQFRTPATIHEATQQMELPSPKAVEEGVALFLRLGLLQSVEMSTYAPERGSSEETLSAWLHVTNACNLRCTYCYLGKTSEHMADDTAQRAVDAIFRSAIKHNFKRIRLKYAGGEASLQMANVLAIHDYATQLAKQHNINFHAYIMSNGVVLPQRYVEQMKARNIGVMISMDGIGDYHDSQRAFIGGQGSFKYVDRTISQLQRSGLRPHINVTVSQRNLDGLPDLTQYMLERELSFTFSYYRDNDYSTHVRDLQFADAQMIEGMQKAFHVIEQYMPRQRLIDSLIDKASMRGAHQHTCGVGRTYMVIDQHGQVAKCHADMKQTITTIDNEDPLQVIRNDKSGVQAIEVEKKQGCRTCDWRYWCTGGCPLLTYRITGRNDIKSPNCSIYKALFPEALRLEALRLLKYETPVVW